jgi:hypothetical protein
VSYLLSAWDSQGQLQRWVEVEVEAEAPVVEAEAPVVEAEALAVEAEQPVVEAPGSAAREFPGTRLLPLRMPRHPRP